MTNLCCTKLKTGAEIITEFLKAQKTDKIFGYPGSTVLKLYDVLSHEKNIQHILVRHEQAAVHMAEGYARISGKTGVALVTSGPGITNTITGLMNANTDGIPVVLIAGLVNKELIGSNCFQDVDIISLTKACSKKTFCITDINDLQKSLEEAFEIANSGKGVNKGVVVIGIAKNVFDEKINYHEADTIKEKDDLSPDVSIVYDLIKSSKHPLVLVGGGCTEAEKEIREFINLSKIPVVSTLMGRGCFDETNELYIGMTGKNGHISADKMLNDCDLLIALGTRYSNKFGAISAKIVRVNIEDKSFGLDDEIYFRTDVKTFLTELLKNKEQITKKSIKISKENKEEILSNQQKVLKVLYEKTKDFNPVVVTEVGEHQIDTASIFRFRSPKKFVTSGGMGTMGFGFPAAIGSCIANKKDMTILIAGDGSFQMNIQELATCMENKIPLKIIIMKNDSLGMIKQQQKSMYGERYYQSDLTNPDFVKIAEAYNIKGVNVSTIKEFEDAVDEMILSKETFLISVNNFDKKDI
ncbi:thiamine pyrophosphate-binding protein [bacterium]|nr:thiamine pyrophosphate-binding protein [bacterium]